MCFIFPIKHTSWFYQSRTPHYSQHSPCSAISTGGIVAFGSPLAKDCRLIIARRCWNLLMNGKHHVFWITNGLRRRSYSLLPSDYTEGESFLPPNFSPLLAEKLQRPLNRKFANEHASVAPPSQFQLGFEFFFFNFSQKLRGRVTRNIEKKAHGLSSKH